MQMKQSLWELAPDTWLQLYFVITRISFNTQARYDWQQRMNILVHDSGVDWGDATILPFSTREEAFHLITHTLHFIICAVHKHQKHQVLHLIGVY